MMPEVTVPASPNGEPIATTSWPTTATSERPNCTGGASRPTTWTTARSYAGDRPTSRAVAVAPLSVTTWIEPPRAAAATTWLFVRMWPEPSITKPEPVALESSAPSTFSWTTLGSRLAATAETEPLRTLGSAVPTPMAGPGWSSTGLALPSATTLTAAPAPATRPTSRATRAANAMSRPLRGPDAMVYGPVYAPACCWCQSGGGGGTYPV